MKRNHMPNQFNQLTAGLLLMWSLGLMAGCASSPPTHWYLLSSQRVVSTTDRPAHTQPGPTIGVGPITIPEYLHRPQIVRRTGDHEVVLSEFHKWAQPMTDGVLGVVVENLNGLLKDHRVIRFPWKRATQMAYHVRGEVTRFESFEPRGDVELIVHWDILTGTGDTPLVITTSRVTVPISTTGHAAIVSAMSRALDEFSQDIAVKIRALPAPSHSAP